MKKNYLAIDLGTTGCRSILFDGGLNILGSAYEEYGLITPRENWTEQNAEDWWNLTVSTAKAAISGAGIDPTAIDGISVSSQGITVVPVDRDWKPLCNALSWLDVRAEKETAAIQREYGDRYIFELTGKHIDPCYTLPKLLWLRENRSDLWDQTWKFVMPMDFLIGRFTGNCVTDHSMASGTLLYDLKNCCWSQELLEHYQIDPDKLPQIQWSGSCAGYVQPSVAEELGLRPDCVVAVGAQDQKCAALGAGIQNGTMTISLGTAGAIEKLWTEVKTAEHTNVGWCGNVNPGTWVTEGVINTAGTCLRWVRDLMFPGESYDTINREAAESAGSLLFYPYMNGPSSPDYYPDSQGCFYGVNLATRRGDFASAVMDGIAYQIRILLEAMDAYGSVETLVLFGGGAKSPLWCQKIADISGMEIRVPSTEEAAGAGAAMLAAQATGAKLNPLQTEKTYFPHLAETQREEKYKHYRTIEKKLWGQEESNAAN